MTTERVSKSGAVPTMGGAGSAAKSTPIWLLFWLMPIMMPGIAVPRVEGNVP